MQGCITVGLYIGYKKRHYKFNMIGSAPQPVLARSLDHVAKHSGVLCQEPRGSARHRQLIWRRWRLTALNGCKVAESLVKIHCNYQALQQLIKKMYSSKYTLAESHEVESRMWTGGKIVWISASTSRSAWWRIAASTTLSIFQRKSTCLQQCTLNSSTTR